MNYQQLSAKKKFQLLMVMTLVVWATTTMLHQMGFGAEAPAERFVPAATHPATLELRSEITIHESEVKLRQLCRWSDRDAAFFGPMADLTIAHCMTDAPFHSIGIDEIKRTLHDAGVNVAMIRFSGTTQCTIARSDVHYDEHQALAEWIAAREGRAPASPMGDASTKPSSAPVPAKGEATTAAHLQPPGTRPVSDSVDPPVLTLRDLIVADAALRLAVPADQLQINFNPADDKVLALPQSQFKFNIEARRVHNLGEVAWDVLIITETGSKKVPILATARAWQKQIVVSTPLAYKQVIRASDVIERRTLVDRLSDEPLLTLKQAVGQQAARDLKPGMILSARMVDPVQLIKTGQFVTVTLQQGNINVKTVVRAMESGSYGQTVRVKNEATRDTYEIVVTGPQEGTMSPVPEERRVADVER